jgi:RNA polymerase-interacting CarD/CdnL/TRCF family regulator
MERREGWFTKKLAIWGALIGVLVPLASFATWAGLRPVVLFEHLAHASDILRLDEDSTRIQLRELKRDWRKNQQIKSEYQLQQQAVPAWVYEEEDDIEAQQLRLEDHLEEVLEKKSSIK